MIKDMEQGIESRVRATVKDTRSKFQDFSLKTFLSRYFDRLTGEARPGWVCGWSQASPCQELDWQGVRSFQPSEFYRDRSFLLERQLFLLQNFKFSGGTSSHILSLPHSLEVMLTAMACLEYRTEFHLQTVQASISPQNSKWAVIKCKTAWGGRIWITAPTYQFLSACKPVQCPVHAVESLAGKASSRNNFEPILISFNCRNWKKRKR